MSEPFPRRYACGPTYPYDSGKRTAFSDDSAAIYAWPSRGGVIVLDAADAVDFEFLNLDPLDPPMKRFNDQAAEDHFCEALLHLGAKWWDSEARYSIVSAIEEGSYGASRVDSAFYVDVEPPPTMSEKRAIKVGWPSTGGVWITEFDTSWGGVDEEENLLPWDQDFGRLKMARTMDERCDLLRNRFQAVFYINLETYKGHGFFNAWPTKFDGEVGPLLLPHQTREIWEKSYYSIGHQPSLLAWPDPETTSDVQIERTTTQEQTNSCVIS